MTAPARKNEDPIKRLDTVIIKTSDWLRELTMLKTELEKQKPYLRRIK
jgi:hypothetical protein